MFNEMRIMWHNTEFEEMKLYTDDWWCPSPCLIRMINAGDGIGGWIIAFHSAFINMSDWNVGYCIIGIMSGCDSYQTRWENLYEFLMNIYNAYSRINSFFCHPLFIQSAAAAVTLLKSQKISPDARLGIPIAIAQRRESFPAQCRQWPRLYFYYALFPCNCLYSRGKWVYMTLFSLAVHNNVFLHSHRWNVMKLKI